MNQFATNMHILVQRFTPLRRLGWAFLLAWVFCVFYLGIIGDRHNGALALGDVVGAAGSSLGIDLYYSCLPVGMSVLMLIFIVAMERRWGSPCQHRFLFALAPIATAFSTPLIFIGTPSPVANLVIFAVGSMLTGFGSGFLWVMWGEYYARLSLEDVEFLAPVSAVIAALITLVMTAVEGWISIALGMLFPLVSGLCLWLSWQTQGDVNGAEESRLRSANFPVPDGGGAQPAQGFGEVLYAIGRTGFGILSACLFVCFVGSFWESENYPVIELQLVLLVSIAFMLAVGLSSMAKPRRVSLTFLYRWMCPALVFGLAAIIIGGEPWGAYVAFCVSVAARFAFCLMTQMYFARYAMSGRITAVQSYGLGWIFVHLGDLLGVLTLMGVNQAVEDGLFPLTSACVVAMVLLVLAVMFVLNDDTSFAIYPEGLRDAYTAVVEAEMLKSEKACEESVAGQNCHRLEAAKSDGNEADEGLGEFPHGCETSASTESGSAKYGLDDTREKREAHIDRLAAEHHLTPRETEVFALLAQGRSVPYIRDALVISKETAATHAKRIYAKLGVHSRQDLIDLVQAGE